MMDDWIWLTSHSGLINQIFFALFAMISVNLVSLQANTVNHGKMNYKLENVGPSVHELVDH